MSYKIAIDAGHGGYDSGAVGSGLEEKNQTLKTALYLNDLLKKDGRFESVLTRTGDFAPAHYENQLAKDLLERCRIANDFEADLFVSIHFNSSGNGQAHGCEVEVSKDFGTAGKFAHAFVDAVSKNEGLSNRGVRETGSTFAVIRETKMPAVMTESAFIDNKSDIMHFTTDEQLLKLAKYHYIALCKTFDFDVKQEVLNDSEATVATSEPTQPEQQPEQTSKVYPTVKVELNGNPFDDGINVDGITFIKSSALDVIGTQHQDKGDGIFEVNGEEVGGIVYENSTYLPWSCLGKGIVYVYIDGGYNFIVTPPQVTSVEPEVSTPTETTPEVANAPTEATDAVTSEPVMPTVAETAVVETVEQKDPIDQKDPTPVTKPELQPVPFVVPTPRTQEEAIQLMEASLNFLKGVSE